MMTCDQLDDLRNQGSSLGAPALPRSAQEHLQSCSRCREFQALWDAPTPVPEIPVEVQTRITERISSTLHPVSPLPSSWVLVTTLLFLEFAVVAAEAWWFGESGWRALAPLQSAVIFSLLGAGMLLMAYVVTCLMAPGRRQPISPRAAITGVSAAFLAAVLSLFPYSEGVDFFSRGLRCLALGVISSTVAAMIFFAVVRRNASLSPLMLGASTGFLGGLAGLTVLEIHCPYQDSGHIGVWHLGAALTGMLIGAGVAAIDIVRRTKIET